MPCVLKRVVENGRIVFEGNTGEPVVLQPAGEDPEAEVKLISARYGTTKLTVKNNCVEFPIKNDVEVFRYMVETNPPRSWVRMNEACEGCGSDDVKMLQRFKATEPPTSCSLTIRGI